MSKYEKQISLGYDREGKRIRKWARGDTKLELNQNIERLKKEYSISKNLDDTTFKEYADYWVDTYKKTRSPRTYAMYKDLINTCSDLHFKKIKDIKRSDIQNIINDLSDRPNLCNKALMCLKQIFKSAILDEKIIKNPAEGIDKPKLITKKETRSLSEKEKEQLLLADFTEREELFVNILLHFGLRPGEALALTTDSFDLDKKILTIDKAITFVGNNAILKGTKTGAVRYLPIPDTLIPYLGEHIGACGNILFSHVESNGSVAYMTKMAYRIFKNNILEKINKSFGGVGSSDKLNGMTMYTFRHNKATALYYVNGISLKAKAEYMGHSVNTLLKIYSHIDRDKENSELFNTI